MQCRRNETFGAGSAEQVAIGRDSSSVSPRARVARNAEPHETLQGDTKRSKYERHFRVTNPRFIVLIPCGSGLTMTEISANGGR